MRNMDIRCQYQNMCILNHIEVDRIYSSRSLMFCFPCFFLSERLECRQCTQKMTLFQVIMVDVRTCDVLEPWLGKVRPVTLYPKVSYNIHSQVSMVWWNCINQAQASICALSELPTILVMIIRQNFLQLT